ncbi:hypothetical protein CHS0354_010755 [Potamilus streckersoni]|uniref:Uncharacterized protein n=1 Tax=Potamilus streckersoni TaxID=2493646 RepID=A0AAE0T9B4_9BIVA|nr:hypothetical protein CHS0354_010755 [Potamilus streckersoni]
MTKNDLEKVIDMKHLDLTQFAIDSGTLKPWKPTSKEVTKGLYQIRKRIGWHTYLDEVIMLDRLAVRSEQNVRQILDIELRLRKAYSFDHIEPLRLTTLGDLVTFSKE